MAMLSSYTTTTLLSRAPAPAPGKSSPAAALQLRSRQPAAASSVAALRWSSCKESLSRASVFACQCHADNKNDKYTYNIKRDVLVHTSTLAGDDWSIVMGDKDVIILKLRVGESTTDDKLEIQTTENHSRLVIRYKGNISDDSPASKLNVELTIPPGCDGAKAARALLLPNGWLIIAIAKPKHEAKKIGILQTPPP